MRCAGEGNAMQPSRKRRSFFDDFFNGFGDFSSFDMEDDFARMQEHMNELMRQALSASEGRKGPHSSVRVDGPFVYGFSMRVGPDGKPSIQEFGNVPKKAKVGEKGSGALAEREPLVDVMAGEKEVTVIAEVPGVEKRDIHLKATPDSLSIEVNTQERKYQKRVELPVRVREDSAKALYKNGVLEVRFDREKPGKPESGKTVTVE